jgi:hypothetical protein
MVAGMMATRDLGDWNVIRKHDKHYSIFDAAGLHLARTSVVLHAKDENRTLCWGAVHIRMLELSELTMGQLIIFILPQANVGLSYTQRPPCSSYIFYYLELFDSAPG